MNVFKEMALSIYSYESYSQFIKNKKGKIFGFGVLLVTLYFFITWVIPALIHPIPFSDIADSAKEEVPYFTLQNGTLWVDGVYEEDTGTSYVYINTTNGYVIDDIGDLGKSFSGYDDVMLVDSEKIMQKSANRWQTTYFSDLGFNFSKDDLVNFIPWLSVIVVIFYIFVYFFVAVLFFFGALVVALLGMIVASGMHYRITFGQMYMMAIYSRTCPLLLKALVSFLPFKIPFFWIINFAISLFIIGMAIMQMKDQGPMNPPNMQHPPYGQYPPNMQYPQNGQYPPNMQYPQNGQYPPNMQYPQNGQYPPNMQNPQGNYPPPGYPM